MLIYEQHPRHANKQRKEESCGEIERIKKVLPVDQGDQDDNSGLLIHDQNVMVHGT